MEKPEFYMEKPLKGIALFLKILRDVFPVLQTLNLRPVVISEIKKVLDSIWGHLRLTSLKLYLPFILASLIL